MFDLKRHVGLRSLMPPMVSTMFGTGCSIGTSTIPVRAGDRRLWPRRTAPLSVGPHGALLAPRRGAHLA
jgi:hypothetical protein